MVDIKTIVLDLGGVYFTPGAVIAVDKIREIYDITDIATLKRFFSDEQGAEGSLLRRGLITMDEFENRLFTKLKIPERKNINHTRYLWYNAYCPHYGMKDLVKYLKGKYRLVIFSGNIKERVEFLEKRNDFLKYFDDTVFSYDCHKNKSDIEFYKELVNHINCEPSEALLIDDEKKNLKMARSLGLNGIHFYYIEKLIEDLKKFNIDVEI